MEKGRLYGRVIPRQNQSQVAGSVLRKAFCYGVRVIVVFFDVSWNDMQPQLATILSAGNTEELLDILLKQDFAFQKYVKTYENLFTDLTDSGIDFE